MQQHLTYLIQQSYTVTLDETAIDVSIAESMSGPSQAIEAYRTRLHSLYRAIVAHPMALDMICKYRVLCEHDTYALSGMFLKDHYRQDVGFTDIFEHILTWPIAPCFSDEDRAWWEETVKDYEEAERKYLAGEITVKEGEMPQRGSDLHMELEPLEQCFKVERGTWTIEATQNTHVEGTIEV